MLELGELTQITGRAFVAGVLPMKVGVHAPNNHPFFLVYQEFCKVAINFGVCQIHVYIFSTTSQSRIVNLTQLSNGSRWVLSSFVS